MSSVGHVTPVRDLIEHDTSTSEADCPCGPDMQPVHHNDGSYGWLLVHHSLDERE